MAGEPRRDGQLRRRLDPAGTQLKILIDPILIGL